MILIISIGFAILGFGTAINEYIKLKKNLSNGVKTTGRKAGMTTILGNDNDRIEVPFIEYTDVNGRIIKIQLDSNLHNKKDEISIIYDPKNPRKIIVDDWTKNIGWVSLLTFGLLSAIMLTIQLASR